MNYNSRKREAILGRQHKPVTPSTLLVVLVAEMRRCDRRVRDGADQLARDVFVEEGVVHRTHTQVQLVRAGKRACNKHTQNQFTKS